MPQTFTQNDGTEAAAASAASPAYLTATEADALLGGELLSSDQRLVRFAALGSADKALLLARATVDIDACKWQGEIADSEQRLMWPRVLRRPALSGGVWTPEISEYLDADPDADGTESVAYLPKAVRRACAVQAAHHAARAAGTDPTHRIEEATRRGVTSVSGGGRSETFDLRKATSPFSRLCLEAQQLLATYRAVAVGAL